MVKYNALFFITAIVFLYSIYLLINFFSSTVSVRSNLDGKYYIVKKSKNSQRTSDTLALINKNVKVLLSNIRDTPKFKTNIDALKSRYREGSLSENIYLDSTSFTINKGESISFCITTRDSSEKVYDINLLMFVTIHELSHVGCTSIGHDLEFRQFFKFLLEEAMRCGIYRYTDYSKKPVEYCGMNITGSPV